MTWKYCLPIVSEAAFAQSAEINVERSRKIFSYTSFPDQVHFGPQGWAMHVRTNGQRMWHLSRLCIQNGPLGNEMITADRACSNFTCGNDKFHGLFRYIGETKIPICQECQELWSKYA